MKSDLLLVQHFMCERVYTFVLHPSLFEMGRDHPYVLVEDGLG